MKLVAGVGATAAAAALTGLVAIPAKHRTIAARLEWNSRRLAATGADDGRSLGRSRTISAAASTLLVILLGHPAGLAPLWGRVTAFLEERLISSGEGEFLPAIAAL